MNRENIIASFANAVSEVEENHFEGTYHWHLGSDDNGNDWAIVMAYMDYNDNGNEELCAKLAYQPSNSIMQCDYDIDWLMPYDEESGEVWYTELPVYSADNAEEIVNWMLNYYYEFNKSE